MKTSLLLLYSLLPMVMSDAPPQLELLDHLLDPRVYDPSLRPGSKSGEATRVKLDLEIKSLGPVNDIDMEFSIGFFLRQEWRDERLQHDDLQSDILIGYHRLTSLWLPDLFFPQSRYESRHEVTTPNVMLRLWPNGTIMYSQRVSLTVRCPMNLINFPMDSQSCTVEMESYSHTDSAVFFTWSTHRNATSVQPDANIPDFILQGVSSGDCLKVYATGNFSCKQAIIHLSREIGYYATQTYIPSFLIVVLSWASFWIDHEAVPARISVGLLTVLTITTQSSGARAQLPRVPYVKAIDVWMATCLFFVFVAYMEFAVVAVLSRRYKKLHERKTDSREKVCPRYDKTDDINHNPSQGINTGGYVDKLSRIGFPSAFMLFNIIYWAYYKNVD